MSVEWLDGKWYITTACPVGAHEDGKPCPACWPDSHNHPPPRDQLVPWSWSESAEPPPHCGLFSHGRLRGHICLPPKNGRA